MMHNFKHWRVDTILPVPGEMHPWVGKFVVAFYQKRAILGEVEEVNVEGEEVMYTLRIMERHGPDRGMFFTFAGENGCSPEEHGIVKHNCIFALVHNPIRMPIEKYILPGAAHSTFITYYDMFSYLK